MLPEDFYVEYSPIVIDIECMPLPYAAEYLEPIPDPVPDESPITPARNLVDPSKIAADIEKRAAARAQQHLEALEKVEKQRADRIEKLPLDRNLGRIAAIGWWTAEGGFDAGVCADEGIESEVIQAVWRVAKRRPIIGFNIKGFDLPYMIQRSRYLGVKHPHLDLGKYSKRDVTDLYLELTFNEGKFDEGAMRRTLHAFCKRFGIPVQDDIKGKDIPDLAVAGEWDQVEAHVRSDVALTVALAQRLGLVKAGLAVTA